MHSAIAEYLALPAGCILACAIVVGGLPPVIGAASAQTTAVDSDAAWTQSLGEPTIYVEYARTGVTRRHYQSAASNLRKAASILEARAQRAYGLDRRRLADDAAALRLTARDVAAGAVTTRAQLDAVLGTTHAHVARTL